MGLKSLFAGGVAAAVFACAAIPAGAVTMIATFKGKIDIVYNADLTFGTADLLGRDYTAIYAYDTALGTDSTYVPLPGYFDTIRGGGTAATSPVRSLSVTINGVTDSYSVAGALLGESFIERINNPAAPRGSLSVTGSSLRQIPSPIGGLANDSFYFGSNFAAGTEIPFGLDQPWAPGAGAGRSGFNHFAANAGRGFDFAYNIGGTVTSVRVAEAVATAPSAAPEPASWALLITGFGAAGAMLRRRRWASLA